jgi:hypothetical protein
MKRKKYIMFLWLFLTALLLSTTTFAWLSANRIFEINTFDIQIVSKGGLEISADGKTWKGVLGMLDLYDANETYPNNLNQIPDTIKPVSSGGQIEDGLLKLYYGQSSQGSDGDYYLSSQRTIEKTSFGYDPDANFVVFDLFLKTSFKRTLKLDSLSKISIIDGEGRGITNAFRVAFLNEGNAQNNDAISTIQNLKKATKAYIWEPNYDTHTLIAVEHARDLYNINTQETNASKIEYHGIINNFSRSSNVKTKEANSNYYPNLFVKVPIDIYTTRNNESVNKIFEIESGITKVRIYVWIEGQDVDCENNAASVNVSIDLHFIAEQS